MSFTTGDNSRPAGMNWVASMTMPSGYNDGTIAFVQKITMTRDDYFKTGQSSPHNINQYHSQLGLDAGYLFFGSFQSTYGHSNDSPQQGYNTNMQSSVSSDSFDTWLMFLPSGNDSA